MYSIIIFFPTQKKYFITIGLHGWPINILEVFIQYKRFKPSPGTIWVYFKVWDMFKDIINQGKVCPFFYLVVISSSNDYWI